MSLRRLSLLRIAGVGLFPLAIATAACGGDEASTATTPGGTAGKAGAAGTTGGAGTSAGKGGAPAGGSSGGGGATGGTSASGGKAGTGGAAGNAAGAAGSSAGAAGNAAGAAGATAGSGGTAGAAGSAAGTAGAAGSANACGAPEGAECDTKLKGICGKGREKCIQGVLSCVQETGPGEKPETCNGLDDDCDGVIDNGLTVKTFFKDDDKDGYGSDATASGCAPPDGYVEKGNDCVDTNPAINPGVAELCNEIDDNCNGQIDEGVQKPTWYKDADGDGYGSTQQTVACFQPAGFVPDAGDCVDGNAKIFPGAPELCNEIDDDCDNVPDNGLPLVATYRDVDGDGFGSVNAVVKMDCLVGGTDAPPEYALTNSDCDDSKSTVYPGAPELCDGVLNNCLAKDQGADYSCPTQCAGAWPIALNGGVGTVTAAQLDDDSDIELVVSQGGKTSVINPNGSVLWTGVGGIYSFPVLADVNQDDTLDVIVPSGGKLHVLHGTTGAPIVPAIDAPAVHSYYGASIFDIDNDGYVDVVPTQLGTGPSPLIKFGAGASSTVLSLASSGGPFFLSNAALWDHDGNGESGIFLGSGTWSCRSDVNTCRGRLHVFDKAGSLLFDPAAVDGPFTNSNFPTTYSSEGQWPVVADFDHDGVAELAANFSDGTYVFDSAGAKHPLSLTPAVGGVFYAPIDADGVLTDGKLNRTSGPAVDIEGDGTYETFSQGGEGLILTSRGKVAPGYPLPIKGYAPIVGDFNRDGALDIVWVGDNNSLNCQTLKPKTYKNERILYAGGYGTVGAGGIYPTHQHDPYEPNQPSAARDPKTSTSPRADFRAFSPLGMRLAFQSGAGNRHLVTAELGTKGDEDWYYIENSYTQIDLVSHVPSKLDVTVDVYAYLPDGGGWKYACEASGKSLSFHPLSATGTCPVGLGQKGLLMRVRGVDPNKDFGPYPYSLTFIWR